MIINSSKCNVISSTSIKNKIVFDYHTGGSTLQRTLVIRDLGGYHDEGLTFRPHYDYLIFYCHQLLGFISRYTKEFTNQSTLLYLYFSLVRNKLEYASVLWSPHYNVLKEFKQRFSLFSVSNLI
ncbi:unnamed protein product [Chilo suppressalis]|uniref:Uncharacterized protein n=1 Tax=Chilo suppressalis TaxID=168631 RepID=A0ABN8AS63_CHISP|nr:unnamed protein product [Chilo suppressalis]